MIDLHEDLQIYLTTPNLVGYPKDYLAPRYDQFSQDRQADLPAYRQVGLTALLASVFPYVKKDEILTPLNVKKISKLRDWYLRLTDQYPEFKVIFNKKAFKDLKKQKKIGIILHLEGLAQISSRKEVRLLSALGFRSIGLCWNIENDLCSTCSSQKDQGLKIKGQALVEEIMENGLILDLTHTSFKTQDVILGRYHYNKIIFSHGGIWEANHFEQNVRQTLIKELHRRGGLVGLTFFDLMINSEKGADSKDLLRHIKLAKDYPEVIALGTDFFGFEPERGLRDLQRITDCELLHQKVVREFGQAFAENLFFKNASVFLERALP